MMKIKPVLGFLVLSFLMMPLGIVVAKSATDKLDTDNNRIVAGWLEYVVLEPWHIKLRAKLDTGAKTSSLHAVDIERFKRDGAHWVRFRTADKKSDAITQAIELPLKREVKIKSHHKRAATRPVVELSFCLNGHVYLSEFSLIDRGRFNYPILLGRRVLKQGILVDASTTFTLPIKQQRCKRSTHQLEKVT
jgi:hypothetical protein